MSKLIESKPGVLGVVSCFAGTRVPVEAMFDHLRRGYMLDYFLAQFSTVSREQADAVLELAGEGVTREGEQSAG